MKRIVILILIGVACAVLCFLIATIRLFSHTVRAQDDIEAATPAASNLVSAILRPTMWTPPDPAYRVAVVADGVYVLTYDDLRQAGLPVDTLDPRTLRMFYLGSEIAIRVEGERDGLFSPGDTLLFYGRSVDSLYFAGLLPEHKYTGVNLYWLTYGGVQGKRMTIKNGAQPGLAAESFWQIDHQEQQQRYITEYPRYRTGETFDPRDDHWLWHKVQTFGIPGAKAINIAFPIQNLAFVPTPASLNVRVVGGYDARHGLRLRVNGKLVFEESATWRSFEPFTVAAIVPHHYLVNGANTVQVEIFNVDSNISENYIDWVKLGYYKYHVAANDRLTFSGKSGAGPWRYAVANFTTRELQVYDVTDLGNVQLVEGTVLSDEAPHAIGFGDSEGDRRYVVVSKSARLSPSHIERVVHQVATFTPSGPWVTANYTGGWNLLDTRNGADWIVITHRDFWTATLPLAEYRSTRYRVAMVDVQEIYDHFNGGLLSSESIRAFLEYAYYNWQPPAPQFVLLAGGGTNDMRRYFPNSKTTYVPTLIYPADPIMGETAADNRLVTLVGNDLVPDLHLGRFPAYSALEISSMVSKTIHYEATPPFNDWNTNILFISDDLEGGGGNFYQFSDTLVNGSADPADPENTRFLPAPYQPTKIYLGQSCDLNNPATAIECRTQVIDAINSQGALLVSYIGHAQTKNWASEKLMDQALASGLTNWDKLSIFLPMACFEGFFHEPSITNRSLAESYLLNSKGGAVASWSPTGFGVASGHDWLEQGFFLGLFQEQLPRLGEVIAYGKAYLHNNAPAHKYDDLIDTYHLLGDPALQVQTYVAPTAVDVIGLRAEAQADTVAITWQTASETNILGFYVLRSEHTQGPFSKLTAEPLWAQSAGSASSASYAYHDEALQMEKHYWYKLEVLALDGSTMAVGPVEMSKEQPPLRIYLPLIAGEP